MELCCHNDHRKSGTAVRIKLTKLMTKCMILPSIMMMLPFGA